MGEERERGWGRDDQRRTARRGEIGVPYSEHKWQSGEGCRVVCRVNVCGRGDEWRGKTAATRVSSFHVNSWRGEDGGEQTKGWRVRSRRVLSVVCLACRVVCVGKKRKRPPGYK